MGDSRLFKAVIASVAIAIALATYFLGAKAAILFACLVLLIFAVTNDGYMLIFLVLFCAVFPKINLIAIADTGVSVRFEDFIIAFVLFYVITKALLSRQELKMDRIAMLLFLFLGLTLLSNIFGIMQGTIELSWKSALYFLRRIEYLSFFFVGYYLAAKNSHKTVRTTLVVSLIIVAFVAFFQRLEIIGGFYQGNYISSLAGIRVFATFGHATELAVFAALALIIVFLGLLDGKNKLWWLIAGAAGIFTVLITGNRIVFFSIPVGLAALAILTKRSRYILLPALILIICLMTVPEWDLPGRFSVLTKTETLENIKDIFTEKGSLDLEKIALIEGSNPSLMDYSALMRAYIWVSALKMFMAYPVLGLGQSVLGDFVDNNYIRMLAENGIIVFIVFFLLLYNIWKQCISTLNNLKMPPEVRSYALFIVIMIVNLLVISLTFDVFESARIALLFWLTVGVFFGVRNIYENEQQAGLEEKAA